MPYDEDLADRIRTVIAERPSVTEQKMFGGLAFLVGGNLAVAASGHGGLLVRVDAETSEHLLATTKAEPMVMRGRSMSGWLRVEPTDVRTEQQLQWWVTLAATYAASLPRKARKKQ